MSPPPETETTRVSQLDSDDPRVRSEAAPIAFERTIAWQRVIVVAAATVVFPLVAGDPGHVAWLGYGLLALGWVYAIVVLAFEPYRRFPVLVSAWFTALTDVGFTLAWLLTTGGAESRWVGLLYVVIVVASLRSKPRDTVALGVVASVGYFVLVAALGQLRRHGLSIGIEIFFLLLGAVTCALLARNRLSRLASKLELLDLTQEVAQIGSWEWSIKDGTLVWSDELRRIFGVSASEAPTLASYFAAIHPDDREAVQRAVDGSLAQRAPFQVDHRIVTPAGEVRCLHCRGRVVLDGAGAPRQLVGTAQDVTESRGLQEEILGSRKLASLGTLASGVAHEINNPLAFVASSVTVAQRTLDAAPLEGAPREALREALDSAEEGCRRVVEIVRGLKSFSRTDDEVSRPVDLAGVVDSALAIASHEIGKRVTVVRDYAPGLAVMGSESRLSQVVLNLVVNAAQALREGGSREPEIRVRAEADRGGHVVLEVTDTGSGIRDDDLPKIFDPFFTTKPPGVGTGLGLSICHGIVRDLGGEITVETQPGRGSTFRVTLPAATAPAVTSSRSAADAASPSGTAGAPDAAPRVVDEARRLRVLVVDDEVRFASSLRLLLGDEHDVTVAADGDLAMTLLVRGESSGEPIDVVLCDLMMAGMSGMDLYDTLAREHPTVVGRMIFLTGGATTDRARAFLARPEVCHLEKPVELPRLERAIRAAARVPAPAPGGGAPAGSSEGSRGAVDPAE